MKKHIIQIFFAIILMTIVFGCHDDDFLGHQKETVIEFDSTHLEILENSEQHIVQIYFDKPAAHDGSIRLSTNISQQSRLYIEPELSSGQIILDIQKGQTSASFMIRPVNNTLTDGDLNFDASIASASSEFSIGEKKSISIKLKDDDSSLPAQSVATFTYTEKTVNENDLAGRTFSIRLSKPPTTPGTIELWIESDRAIYGTHFVTEPAAISGRVILNPAIGQSTTGVTILPINNSTISGELKIALTIVNTTGSIVKGSVLNQDVFIADDELINKPMGYEISGGGWSLRKTYEYDELGRVKYVHNEKSTPATSAYTETYYYDSSGEIQRINTYPEIDVVFTWSNGRIVKSENNDRGLVKEYTEFDYDNQGNVSGAANYFRQPDGQFKLGFLNVYLYFLDGNLHKSQTYIPGDGPSKYTLISTRTYDGYLAKENLYPMVEILPNVKAQTSLPSTYTIEEHGLTLIYSFTYEYGANGLVTKRLARSGNLTETALYHYY